MSILVTFPETYLTPVSFASSIMLVVKRYGWTWAVAPCGAMGEYDSVSSGLTQLRSSGSPVAFLDFCAEAASKPRVFSRLLRFPPAPTPVPESANGSPRPSQLPQLTSRQPQRSVPLCSFARRTCSGKETFTSSLG